jgi:hypothetical protein
MPWNYPYYQVARFVEPNLLLGNTILLKHAPSCPKHALQIADIITAAGAPTGVYQNLFATNEQVAAIIASPLLQGVSLTGSQRAGQTIGSVAGAHMRRCVLELGGSDPFIVLADANVSVAAREAATGRFLNAGQACTLSKRILVENAVWDRFSAEFLIQASKWTVGDPSSSETRLGPMTSVGGRAELAAQVAGAVDKGAVVHLGGSVPDGPGAFYTATVLTGVDQTMRASREVLFRSQFATRWTRPTGPSTSRATHPSALELRSSAATTSAPVRLPTGSTSEWSESILRSRAHPRCRLVASKVQDWAASSDDLGSRSLSTRNSYECEGHDRASAPVPRSEVIDRRLSLRCLATSPSGMRTTCGPIDDD